MDHGCKTREGSSISKAQLSTLKIWLRSTEFSIW